MQTPSGHGGRTRFQTRVFNSVSHFCLLSHSAVQGTMRGRFRPLLCGVCRVPGKSAGVLQAEVSGGTRSLGLKCSFCTRRYKDYQLRDVRSEDSVTSCDRAERSTEGEPCTLTKVVSLEFGHNPSLKPLKLKGV